MDLNNVCFVNASVKAKVYMVVTDEDDAGCVKKALDIANRVDGDETVFSEADKDLLISAQRKAHRFDYTISYSAESLFEQHRLKYGINTTPVCNCDRTK